MALWRALDALDRASQHDRAAVGLDVALQRQHQAVAVDDAGGGRDQRGDACQLGLERARSVAPDRLQIGDAVLRCRLPYGRELGPLALLRGDDELAAARMAHVVLGAEAVEQLLAAHAQPRPQAARRIVDAGVDHLAVARGGFRADQLVLLQNHQLVGGRGQRAGNSQSHHAGAHHDGFNVWRHATPTLGLCA